MENRELSIEEKEKIHKLLIKVGITNETLSEVRAKMLESWDNTEKLSKPTEEEKEKLRELKYFYKRDYEENLKFAEKIFKLHKELLNSENLKIRREALEVAEEIIKKYKITTADILQKLTNRK